MFCRIISRFLTKCTHNINESLFKQRKHLKISATLYLVVSALCNHRQTRRTWQLYDRPGPECRVGENYNWPCLSIMMLFNRAGVARAVLQSPLSFINSLINWVTAPLVQISSKPCNPKPEQLGSWKFKRMFISQYVSCVMCHVSRVTCPMSHVTCHLSPVTCNFFYFFIYYL